MQSQSESPYLLDRGFRLNPHLDLRTPSYTANGDATRNNQENVWDLDFWDGLFSMMSKLRYNMFEFSETCTLPSMLEVPGYEDCALDDVYYYTGEYDDSYYGNSTNMFRNEHLNEGNYYVFKKMTIQEKTKHWQDDEKQISDKNSDEEEIETKEEKVEEEKPQKEARPQRDQKPRRPRPARKPVEAASQEAPKEEAKVEAAPQEAPKAQEE